jgi:hypothetical protein
MRRRDGVGRGEHGGHTDRRRLLADGRVHATGDLAAQRQLLGSLFEPADEEHPRQPADCLVD